ALQKQLAELKLLQDSAKPLIEDKTLLDRLGFFSETFTGQITLLLNAATPDLVFSNLRAEAMGSEVKINCKIDAETYPAAQNFVAAASKGPNVINAMLLSQKRGEELGDSSVSFDFVKRMKVNQ
ncbi:MAG TPA: hypothetical protein VEX38_06005, partial [Fimbriimonadaceae bacterium]|nr:hypothetical protein [Fimbriimonadaceae bacterium]